jgi:hypothetical protein
MNTPETDPRMENKCPQCGGTLPTGALGGLCPACLLEQGAAPETSVQPETPPFQPPSLEDKALTLRHCPACVALAIRICSRRTSCLTRSHSMAFHAASRGREVSDASAPNAFGAVICFLCFSMVLQVLLPGLTRPTWAYPSALPLALASSVIPMLRPLTRLAVRSVRVRDPTGLAAFPCSVTLTG